MGNEHFYARCTVCGGLFETSFFGRKNAKYCDVCRREVNKQQSKEASQKSRERKKRKKAEEDENRTLTLSEIAALARENGMTYGQFVAKFPNK